MTETGSGVVYDGLPLEGVELAVRPLPASPSNPAPHRGPLPPALRPTAPKRGGGG